MLENIQLTEINGEKVFEFSICADHRDQEIPIWQKKVFDKFGAKINQLYFEFGRLGLSHGQVIDWIMEQIKDRKDIDYVVMWENDSLPLRKDYLQIIYDKIKDKNTIMGSSQRSQHKVKFGGTTNHVYAATPFSISIKLYNKIGRPTFDHHIPRSDTYEEVGFRVEELGYNVCLVYPRSTIGLTPSEMEELHCPTPKALVCQEVYSGFGTVFGDNLWFHTFFPPVSSHKKHFIQKCQEVLSGKFDNY